MTGLMSRVSHAQVTRDVTRDQMSPDPTRPDPYLLRRPPTLRIVGGARGYVVHGIVTYPTREHATDAMPSGIEP